MIERAKASIRKSEAKIENKASLTQKTGPSQSISSPAGQILVLQRTIGNQAVGRLIQSGALKAKLRIGKSDDMYEQEADRVAEQVMRMPDTYAESYPTFMPLHRVQTPLQRAEITPSPVEIATQKQEQQSNRPPRPSDAGTQMSKLLEIAKKEATGQKGKCYAAVKRYILNAGGYGDIQNIDQDERFEGNRLYALQFARAVDKQGAANLGLEKVSGNPMNAEAGTILVLKGHKDLHISEAYGDISVIDSKQGSTLVCYNDGRMILPGPAAIWEGEGKYAATVAGMYRPVSRPALEAAPAPPATTTVQAPAVQPKRLPSRELTVPGSGRSDGSPDYVPSEIQDTLDTSGRPLDPQTLKFMEPRFNHDFSQIRVHADAKAAEAARAVNARAFTVGRDVVFGEGEYTPGTIEGQRLMAHELTHAVQQSGGLVQPQIQRMGDPSQLPGGLACPVAHDSPGASDLDIIFRVNSANLRSSDKAAIDNFVNNWHASGTNKNLRLDGYASPEGPDYLNWTLSCNRAMAVENALTSPASGGPGIPASYIGMFAHGETSEFAAAYSPNRRASIQILGGSPNPVPPGPVQTRVNPCTPMPREIFNRGACGTGADFRYNDFPPLTGTNAAQRAAVREADHLTLDFQLRNRMRLELGGLAGAEGLRMVTHFSGGTGTKLTHGSSSTLGADAFVCGTFSRLHASVIREIERQLTGMDAAGVIDCNAITLPAAGVPAVSFGFSDSTALKAIIGGTQGLSIRITRFSINPSSRTYNIELQYLICDDFGVDTTDLYSPALIAFWVLQHRRSGNVPFINELDLLKAELGHY